MKIDLFDIEGICIFHNIQPYSLPKISCVVVVRVRVAWSVSAGHVPLRQRVLRYQAHWKHNIST